MDFSAAAMPSWADLVDDEATGVVLPTVSNARPKATTSLAAELDMAANNSRDGLNLSFKSVRVRCAPVVDRRFLGRILLRFGVMCHFLCDALFAFLR